MMVSIYDALEDVVLDEHVRELTTREALIIRMMMCPVCGAQLRTVGATVGTTIACPHNKHTSNQSDYHFWVRIHDPA